MKKKFILILIFTISLIALTSNPSKADYVSFVKDELSSDGHPILGAFASPLVSAFTTKQNFGLFTVYETRFDDKDKEYLKAIGIFNHFFWLHTPE
jgi:Domain of unknown function (DUF4359)